MHLQPKRNLYTKFLVCRPCTVGDFVFSLSVVFGLYVYSRLGYDLRMEDSRTVKKGPGGVS